MSAAGILRDLRALPPTGITVDVAIAAFMVLVKALLGNRVAESIHDALSVFAAFSSQEKALRSIAHFARSTADVWRRHAPACVEPLQDFAALIDAASGAPTRGEVLGRVLGAAPGPGAVLLREVAGCLSSDYPASAILLDGEAEKTPAIEDALLLLSVLGPRLLAALPARLRERIEAGKEPEMTSALRARVRKLRNRLLDRLVSPGVPVGDPDWAELRAAETELARHGSALAAGAGS